MLQRYPILRKTAHQPIESELYRSVSPDLPAEDRLLIPQASKLLSWSS